MNFSDHELMMLEQLTYLKETYNLSGCYTPKQVKGETIGERLSVYSESVLQKMENNGEEGQQWAAIIRYIKGNEKMCQLVQDEQFLGPDNAVLGIAYHYKDQPNEGIVTFSGTTSARNWHDNAVGLGTADTPVQKEALAYIENLGYDHITVTGHSKGGNLAQYTTILSDKVTRCVSMDGQGFSGEFLEKYAEQIEMKGSLVTNYSLSTDFVHILLNRLPNATQKYCAGSRIDGFDQHHYANSFFQYHTVEGSNYTVIVTDQNGPMVMDNQPENAMMTYLHNFTCYILNTMPQDQREKMGDYVGNILQMAMKKVPVDGYTNVISYAMSDKKQLGTFIAYLIKYAEVNNLSANEFRDLAEMLGLHSIVGDLVSIIDLSVITDELTDGKRDPIIEAKLWRIYPGLQQVWKETEQAYMAIPSDGREHGGGGRSFDRGGFWGLIERIASSFKKTNYVTRDFSDASKTKLLSLVTQVEDEKWCDFTDWMGDRWYDFESWIGTLDIRNYINDVNTYHKKVIDKNNTTSQTILQIFETVHGIDASYGTVFTNIAGSLQEYLRFIDTLTGFVEPNKGRFNAEYMSGAMTEILQDVTKAEVQNFKDKLVQQINGSPVYDHELIQSSLYSNNLSSAEKQALAEVLKELEDPENMAIFNSTAPPSNDPTGLEKFVAKATPYAIGKLLQMVSPGLGLLYVTSGLPLGKKISITDPSRTKESDAYWDWWGTETSEDKIEGTAWIGKGHAHTQGEAGYAEVNAYLGKAEGVCDIDFAFMEQDYDSTGKDGDASSMTFLKFHPEIGGSLSVFALDGQAGAGSDMLGVEGEVDGAIGKAEAKGEVDISISEKGVNANLEGSLMVAAATGEAKASFNFLGLEITGKAEGHAGALGIEGKVGLEDNKFVLEGGAAAVFGYTLGVEVGFNESGWSNFIDYVTFWN